MIAATKTYQKINLCQETLDEMSRYGIKEEDVLWVSGLNEETEEVFRMSWSDFREKIEFLYYHNVYTTIMNVRGEVDRINPTIRIIARTQNGTMYVIHRTMTNFSVRIQEEWKTEFLDEDEVFDYNYGTFNII